MGQRSSSQVLFTRLFRKHGTAYSFDVVDCFVDPKSKLILVLHGRPPTEGAQWLVHMEPFFIFVFAAWNGINEDPGAGYDLPADAKYFLERLPGRFIEMRNKGKT